MLSDMAMRFDCFTLQSAALPDFWLSSIIACCLRRSREPIGSAFCPRCYVRHWLERRSAPSPGSPQTWSAAATRSPSARSPSPPLAVVPAAFLLRFVLGAVSYAAGTPGGLFAPLLVLGAQFGLLSAGVCRALLPNLDVQPEGFAVVGMAALFTGVVLVPVTGIVLVTEMTASVTILLPMLSACCVAMLVPTLLGDPPIYELLRKRTLHMNAAPRSSS